MSGRPIPSTKDCVRDDTVVDTRPQLWMWIAYLVVGILFGVTLIKSEVASWHRI